MKTSTFTRIIGWSIMVPLLALAEPAEQKLESIDQKIDKVIEGQASLSKQIQEVDAYPLAGRKYGVEFNFFRLLNYENNRTLSGGLSLFGVNRNAEIAFPFYFETSDKDDVYDLRVYTLDAHYRNFLGDKQKGFYISAFARYAHLRGTLGDDFYFGNQPAFAETGSENKLGVGVGIGYRVFSQRNWYWGTSLNVGRYIVGENDLFAGDPIELSDDDEFIFDVEFFKFGWAF